MKKGYLFVGNSSKPTTEQVESLEVKPLGSVVKLPAIAARELGYDIFLGINRNHPEKLSCPDFPANYYDQHTYRNIFAISDNWVAYKNLCVLLKEHPEIEILHCYSPIGGIVGRLAGKRYRVKHVIYTAHGFHFYKGAPLLYRTVIKWIEMWMAHYTDAIITMNKEDYESALKFRLRKHGKVYVIPGVGVDTNSFLQVKTDKMYLRKSLGLPEDAVVAIAMGDIIPRKNYKTAIKAISLTGNKSVHYLICGKGPEVENLKSYAGELGIQNQIHLLGFRTDIKDLVSISDFFLFSSFQEGLPRSTMEAMSAGLPCVISRIRGHVDLIEDSKGGYLIDPKDVKGFADAINKISSSSDLRNEFRSYNLERIKNFDNEVVLNKFRSIFNDILSREE